MSFFVRPLRLVTSVMLLMFVGCGQVITANRPVGEVSAPASSQPQGLDDAVEEAGGAPQAVPKIVVTNTQHDFGEMNPHEFGEHEFVIQNIGDAPLVIQSERSTCKCTVAELPGGPIAVGQKRNVKLRWQTSLNNRRFEESATVTTNDPDHPSLTFRVSGDVLVHVGANPPELVMSGIHPGRSESVTTVVTSQVWEHFDIKELTSSLEGHRWTVEPATETQLEQLKAKSGQHLTLHLPDSLPQGEFNHWVRFQLTPARGESKMYELPLRGKVLRRVAVYGSGIDMTGKVSLGVIPSQQGHRRRLVMKVRDPQPELQVDQITCHPDFLRVKVTPYPAKVTTTKGLYYLDIEVPKLSPVSRFQSSEAGEVTIQFDHPRIEDLRLRVDFAVSGHRTRFSNNQQASDQSAHGIIARRANR